MNTKTHRGPVILSRSADRLLLNTQALIATRRQWDSGHVTRIADRSDATLFACDCGSLFSAPATTHPTCPTCGHEQVW